MNPRINFVSATVVCITISVTLFGVNAATYEAVGPDNIDPTVCLDEVKTGTIIRTEDSMNNKATFVDAVVSDSYAICAEKCCDYGSAKCDTIVYIEGEKDSPPPTEENCYLFKCWFDGEQNMRCLFADHEGYISSTTGGFDSPQITGDRESGEKIETTTRPYVRKTTTPPQSTTSLPKLKPTSESVEAKVPIKSTTKFPERQDEQVCMVTQYRCPQSRECILKRLVCDDIVDCKDKSDEIGCNREYPEGGKKPYQEEISIIQPHIATTVPTPEHGESVDEHTNNQKTTLPPNPPPPTHVEGIISLPPGEGKEQELEVDVESVDTVEVAKGALFPLVVGLLLTVFLLMMVGCRLRFMNRRLRYGRMKNNAHDADYLINGMYL